LVVLDGTYSVLATTTGSAAFVYEALPSTQTNIYADVDVDMVSSQGTSNLLRLRASGGSSIVGLNAQKSGRIVVKDFFTTKSVRSSAASIGTGSWHDLQLHARINGFASTVEVWLDGSRVSDLSGT